MTAEGTYNEGRPPIGARMPVSITNRSCFTRPATTRKLRGSGPPKTSRRVVSTAYVPGGSASANRPAPSVLTRATSTPEARKTSGSPATGALHGASARQTGVTGPRTTEPRTFVASAVAATGVASIATATTTVHASRISKR